MTRKLITILGKAQKGGDYREANYLLDDQTYRISYFGLALDQHLQSDHLIILGTEGSMWDNLAQRLGIDADLALLDAVEQDNVTPAILAPLAQAARENPSPAISSPMAAARSNKSTPSVRSSAITTRAIVPSSM